MSKIIRLKDVIANVTTDPTIVELMDMAYFNTEKYLKTLVPPKPDHLLVLERPFTESEKEQIFTELEFQRVTEQLNIHKKNEIYRSKALENDILISDFNYVPFTPRKVA